MALYRAVVDIEWGGGGSGVNVWHFRTISSPGTLADRQGAVDAIRDFYDAVSSIYPTDTTISMPAEVVTEFQSAPAFEPVTPWTITGDSGTATHLPAATQLVVGWRTTAATRSGRGRTFLGPLAGTLNEANGTPTPGLITTVQTAANDLVAESESALGGWAVGVWSEADGVLRDFTSARVRDVFAVLRSRRD